MSALLDILRRKREDVAKRESRVPYSVLRERAVPTTRSFGEALRKSGARFILECKKASPSKGLIRENFDVAEIAGVYGEFADAVSVLTDEPYFQGSLDILRAFREKLSRPILAKDFVVGPYQVCEARTYGADAVLLMLSVLDDETYRVCADEARRLSMDALTEVHNEEELERAISLGASIIGINNRDLKTLKVDLAVCSRLLGRIAGEGRGKRIAVCESGIECHGDVLRFAGQADAFLVGGSLMGSDRLDLAVRHLIYGNVKVCGLTSPEDAAACYRAGAVFGGLIFARESPRMVDDAAAKDICTASPLRMAGVFVNDDIRRIARLASDLSLAAVQLHGEETGEFIEELRKELPGGCEIWKAVRVGETMPDIEGLNADRALLDVLDSRARGGAGISFDWSLLGKIPSDARTKRVILAGGIGAGNALRASMAGCFAIDVNSGVEITGLPGKKDHEKIKRLFDNLRKFF
ncbi:tryptophan biosynthesis protein TrpCF [Synergistales bacterium]|nr:tryptophan biosynthesis protein TrpCF [Synergistales bacterium]